MTSRFLIFLLLPFIIIVPNILYNYYTPIRYDYFYLVHQWPATFCSFPNSRCRSPPINYFVIHGMWPERDDRHPVPPNKSAIFDPDMVISDLDKYWPSLNISKPNMEFWRKEWEKHGSSSASTLNQIQYFTCALRRYDQLHLDRSLLASNITAGNTSYELKRIKRAIINGSKVVPQIQCLKNTSKLYQILFCISHDGMEIKNCSWWTNCKSDVVLPYP